MGDTFCGPTRVRRPRGSHAWRIWKHSKKSSDGNHRPPFGRRSCVCRPSLSAERLAESTRGDGQDDELSGIVGVLTDARMQRRDAFSRTLFAPQTQRRLLLSPDPRRTALPYIASALAAEGAGGSIGPDAAVRETADGEPALVLVLVARGGCDAGRRLARASARPPTRRGVRVLAGPLLRGCRRKNCSISWIAERLRSCSKPAADRAVRCPPASTSSCPGNA